MDEHGDPVYDFGNPEMVTVPIGIETLARGVGALEPMPGETIVSLNGNQPARQAVRVVTLKRFVAATEEVTAPLIGTEDDSLLPSDGMLLMYGDGGAGKTTLSIDAAVHLAAGADWLGIHVPAPVRVLLIENEGPRGPFRRRLAAKIAAWEGAPFDHNIVVLEEPWTRFTLTDRDYRHQLALEVARHDVGLVIVGPLASLGAKGTGTPDEINEFDQHVKDFREAAGVVFGLWIVHHENKAGDVSGAWERYPDSLVHVQARGNGHTVVVWRKVRWSSTLHGTTTALTWTEGAGFAAVDRPDRDLRAELLAHLPGMDWRTLAELAHKTTGVGANKERLRPILGRLVGDGLLEYAEGRAAGRANKNARCWRLSPAAVAEVDELERLQGKHRDLL